MPESNDQKKFFVVWSPQGGPPVVRFPSFTAARTAAVRLCRNYPEKDVFVLASCWGRIVTPAVNADESPALNPPNPEPEAQS
jgi:hypothetical protein